MRTFLAAQYGGLICDLDGVVYRGPDPVPGAVKTLNMTVADGKPVVFATNNASRPPDAVGDHLRDLGLNARGWSVVTSSQAAAAYLADRLPPRTRVLAVGGPGVAHALRAAGLVPVHSSELDGTQIPAVVQGLGTDVTWADLAEVGHAVRTGATWVATNLDPMLPTARGPAPGNGALVAAVRMAVDALPEVVGKPEPALYELAIAELGTTRAQTLVCGDRLDTDIRGANAAGLDSLLVLSGVCRLQDLAFAPPAARPTYVASDLTGLLAPPLSLFVKPSDLIPDALLRPSAADGHRLLQSVVAAAWAARDEGRPFVSDHGTWHALEQQLGIVPQ